ncbi:glutamyl-tRNA synthetase [Calocera cornea HHB12733]|uniref:Glutamate--tRNA ligase, mitochondrial n=1 Tax=Calocera cornea HHB12733 TaxID=1353952 RepID=A0A165G178_9BASI|nr:glutamyl-tRNA synthetase [Calocera cornea HHB12733]
MPPFPRLRFAPSPTGSFHLGGLRTALFNHLLARKWGGKWLLRIEDTDQTRLVEGSVDEIRSGLEWAGLNYDEGPVVGGKYGPYFQSQRLDLYHSHTAELLKKDHAYRCFCNPAQLAEIRLRLVNNGSMAGYDRTCRTLEPEEVKHNLSLGKPHCIRLSTPDEPTPRFNDLVFGNPSPNPVPVDPIILKSDGYPTYHLANVVDDHAMEITHVLRGEEWLPSVPLHLTLYSAFGWEPPQFAHLPLLLNEDGSKMSKRTGVGAFVSEYREQGWEPETLLNWLVLAGWGGRRDPYGNQDLAKTPVYLSIDEDLIERFDLRNFTHRRSVLAPGLLAKLNRPHIHAKLSDPRERRKIVEKMLPIVKSHFPDSPNANYEFVEKALLALEHQLDKLGDFPSISGYLFQEPDYNDPAVVMAKKAVGSFDSTACLKRAQEELASLEDSQWTEPEIKRALDGIKQEVGGTKKLMSALRYALTGGKVCFSLQISAG